MRDPMKLLDMKASRAASESIDSGAGHPAERRPAPLEPAFRLDLIAGVTRTMIAVPLGVAATGLVLGVAIQALDSSVTRPSAAVARDAVLPPAAPTVPRAARPSAAAQAPAYIISDFIEAEFAELTGGSARVSSQHGGYSGRGYVDGYGDRGLGSTTTFQVLAATAGGHDIYLRYANAMGAPMTVTAYVNGRKDRVLTLPHMPRWDSWNEIGGTYSLDSGLNTFAVRFDPGDSGNINIDAIRVVPLPTPTGVDEAETGGSPHVVDGDGAGEWIERGRRALRAGRLASPRHDCALAFAEEALRRDPGNSSASTLREEIVAALRTQIEGLMRRGADDRAERLLDRAIEISPDDAALTALKATLQGENQAEATEADGRRDPPPDRRPFSVYHQHGLGGVVGGVIESIDRRLARRACEGDLQLTEEGFRFRTRSSPDRRVDDVVVTFSQIRKVVHKGSAPGEFDALRIATTSGNWDFFGTQDDLRQIEESLQAHMEEFQR